jgi:predicted PurR-regulated permease PerM
MNELYQDSPESSSGSQQSQWEMYKRRLFLAVGLIAFLIVLAAFVKSTLGILLLLFLCVLIAIGLRGVSNWIAKHTPLSDVITLPLTILVIATLIVGMVLLVGSRLAAEFSALGDTLEDSLIKLEEQLRQYPWGEELVRQMPTTEEVGQEILDGNIDLFTRVTGVFSATLSFLSSVIIVVFISLFLAAQPVVYRDNFLRLIPLGKRDRVRETLNLVGDTLQTWLLTRFISALVIGALTMGGLTLLNVPLALSLAIVAALAGFIPTFGPILAIIPALLVAFITSPEQVLAVFILYIGIQVVENYLITPFIENRMLYLPPVFTIATQMLFGVIAGSMGLVLAAPLSAALVIIVRMLYVEDVLGDTMKAEQD